jgi:hypothetical protein
MERAHAGKNLGPGKMGESEVDGKRRKEDV